MTAWEWGGNEWNFRGDDDCVPTRRPKGKETHCVTVGKKEDFLIAVPCDDSSRP